VFSPEDIQVLIRAAAQEHGVDPDFAAAIVEIESSGGMNPKASSKGARGIMQLMPDTWKKWGVKNPDDPFENVVAGMKELRQLQQELNGDMRMVARRYAGSPQARLEDTDYYVEKVFKDYRQRIGLPEPRPGEDTDGRIPKEPGQRTAPNPSEAAPASLFAPGPLGQGWLRSFANEPGGMRPTGRHYAHALGLDPYTAEDRPNIGAAAGAAALPLGAAALGIGGWPAFASSVVGAITGGGAGQAYNEQYRTGATPEGSTPQQRIVREGLVQGALELAGGIVVGAGKAAVRAGLEEGISVAAREAMAKAKRGTIEEFNVALDTLKTAIREARLKSMQQSANLTAERRAKLGLAKEAGEAEVASALAREAEQQRLLDAARETATRNYRGVTRQGAADVHAIRNAEVVLAQQAEAEARRQAQLDLRAARRTGAADRLGTRQAETANVEQTRQIGQGALEAMRSDFLKKDVEPMRIGQIPTGEAVLDVVGRPGRAGESAPVRMAESRLGENVTAAADKGKPVNFRQAKKETYRIVKEELLPGAKLFPTQPAPATLHLAEPRLLSTHERLAEGPVLPGELPLTTTVTERLQGPPLHRPPQLAAAVDEDAQLNALLEGVAGHHYDELKKDPVMAIAARIINAPDDVPFGTLHRWYSELSRAKSNLFDVGAKTKVEGLQKHLIGELRRALAAGKNRPYEKAAKNYRELMQLFERADVDGIRALAHTPEGPEKIVQMIDPKRPSQVASLMQILRETSGRAVKTGSTKGRAAGADAAAKVQQAWFSENVLEGGLDGLPERMAALDARPEFVQALFGDDAYQQVLERTRAVAKGWQDEVARVAAEEAAAAASKRNAVDIARERAQALVDRTQAAGEAAVAQARENVGRGRVSVAEAQRRARLAMDRARDEGDAAIKAATAARDVAKGPVEDARAKAAAQFTSVEEETRRLRAAHAKNVRESRARTAAERQDLQTKKRQAGAPTEEELAFKASSLSPERLHNVRGETVKTLRRVLTAAFGLHALGPMGIAVLAAEKGGTRAAEKDLLKFVVHSPRATRLAINWFAARHGPVNVAGGQAARSTGAAVRRRLEEDARKRRDEEARK
jgi:Transglycosylase SLT domain